MATLGTQGKIEAKITIILNEDEAAALEALAGYDIEIFIETFYRKMGRTYLEPHENGLRSLFKAVYGGEASVSSFLRRFEDARAVMAGQKIVRDKNDDH
jgi:hypothetical protein